MPEIHDYEEIPIVKYDELGEAKFPCLFCPTTARHKVKFWHREQLPPGARFPAIAGTEEYANLCVEHFQHLQATAYFFEPDARGYFGRSAYQDAIGVVWAEAQRQLNMSDDDLTLRDLLDSNEIKLEISPPRVKESGQDP